MPVIPMYNQQTSRPTGFQSTAVGPAGMAGEAIQTIGKTAQIIGEQQQAVEQNNADVRAQRLAAYDRDQERLKALEAKEWGDNTASQILLEKQNAFNELQRSIAPDQDFYQEWKKVNDEIDTKAKNSIPEGNAGFSSSLSAHLENQKLSYGMKAIDFQEKNRAENAAYRFDNRIETQRKVAMALDAKEADSMIEAVATELPNDPSLLNMPQIDADKKAKDSLEKFSETVLNRFLDTKEGAETLVAAIRGGKVARRAKAGTLPKNEDGTTNTSGISVKVAEGKWDTDVVSTATRNGVDPDLVLAVMKRESAGKSDSLSAKGAIGLMQLMPQTAKQLGVDPKDPKQNIEGGVKYLRQMSEKFGGDLKLTLAAYNAGPAAVEAFRDGKTIKLPSGKVINPKGVKTPDGIPPYKETQEYVAAIMKTMGVDGAQQTEPEAITYEPVSLNVLKYTTADQNERALNNALRVIEQARKTETEMSRVELNQRIDTEKKSAEDGVKISRPLTESDFIAAGYSPEEARIKYQDHRPTQEIAGVVAQLSGMSKAERDHAVAVRNPKDVPETDMFYGSKRDAYRIAVAANERIDRQVAEDPVGTAVKFSPGVGQAKEDFETILNTPGASPMMIAAKRDEFVAAATSWQRSQGVTFPAILSAEEVTNIKSVWEGQQDGAAKAADVMVGLSQVYGKHFPLALKQLSKDLPSEALWVGILADDPASEGVRQQLATASKVFKDPGAIAQKSSIASAIDRKFSDYAASLYSTDPTGMGVQTWNHLKDGAVKLAALKAQSRGIDPESAAAEAFRELVGSKSVFISSGRIVSSFRDTDGSLQTINGTAVVRIPRDWPGKMKGQDPEDLLTGAKAWLSKELPNMSLRGGNQSALKADIKNYGAFVTSPDDDGLVLTLNGRHVKTADGKSVLITWRRASEIVGEKMSLPSVIGNAALANPGIRSLVSGFKAGVRSYIAPPEN